MPKNKHLQNKLMMSPPIRKTGLKRKKGKSKIKQYGKKGY